MKKCICCQIEKNKTEFSKHSQKKDGLNSYCRECNNKKRKTEHERRQLKGSVSICPTCKKEKKLSEFYKTSSSCKDCHIKEGVKIESEKRIKKSKLQWEKLQPRCYICNEIIPLDRFFVSGKRSTYCSDKCLDQRGKKHYQKNKNEINKKNKNKKKEYYEKVIKPNKKIYEIPCKFCETMIITTSSTRRYCKDRCRVNFYRNKKYKNDILYKIEVNLRSRIRSALKGKSKSKKTIELVGCSLNELKKHLESQFMEGMDWENYSYYGWHIDHIKPCASFNLADPKEQKKCFHYKNLQPLWAIDNLKKSDKLKK